MKRRGSTARSARSRERFGIAPLKKWMPCGAGSWPGGSAALRRSVEPATRPGDMVAFAAFSRYTTKTRSGCDGEGSLEAQHQLGGKPRGLDGDANIALAFANPAR